MNNQIKPPPLSRRRIIRQAELVFLNYANIVGHDFAKLGVNFDHIYEHYIYPEYEIDLIEDKSLGLHVNGEHQLGLFQPELNRVYIDKSLKNDPRRVFTCWHEMGHAILQGDWLRKEINRIGVASEIITTDSMLSEQVENTLEWQANLFAANAAAPMGFLEHVIRERLGLVFPMRYTGPNNYELYVSGRPCKQYISSYQDLCCWMAYYIKHRFKGLSQECLGYRIQDSGYVIDNSNDDKSWSGFGLNRTTKAYRSGSQEIPIAFE